MTGVQTCALPIFCAAECLRETARGQVFHDQPRLAVDESDIVHRDGVGAGEAGGDAPLAHGPIAYLDGLRRAQLGGGRDLFDGHLSVQKCVGGEPYCAHSAATELAGEAVPAGQEVVGSDSPSNTLLIGHAHRLVDDGGVCPQPRNGSPHQRLRHHLDELPSERLY